MSLVVVGTMAFDSIETPFGKIDKALGGSATYIAWAASNFCAPIQQVSIIGGDFPESELELLRKRNVHLEGVEIIQEEKSFYWSGRYHMDMNNRDSLVTDLNVLSKFNPILPESYKDSEYVLLGNVAPALQKQVVEQMNQRPKLVVADTMNFWMDIAMDDLLETLKVVDVLVINDSEARQLSNEYSLVKAAHKILTMGPKYLVIKKGEHGALLFHGNKMFAAPALPLEEVFDPTGAGDSFVGGFMGHLVHTKDISFENMKTAIIVGSAMASFCVEKFSIQRLQEINHEDIVKRIQQFKELATFETASV